MGSYVDQIIYGRHIRVSNHMWTSISNHIRPTSAQLMCTHSMYPQHMKGLGKKGTFGQKMEFLRYSTCGLGLISGLFSRRPFIKILFSHVTTLISRFRITESLPEISRKIFENFRENSPPPILSHDPTPILCNHNQYPKP